MNRRNFFSITAKASMIATAAPLLHTNAFAQEAGLTGRSLTIGCSAALSGPLAAFGVDLRSGVDAALAEINKKGGVNGRNLQFTMMDDAYVPTRTAENVKKMIDDQSVFALMSCMGTPNNQAILPMINDGAIPYVAPLTGASSIRKADAKNVFHVRASYTDETTRLVQQLVGMGITSLAVVYLDNGFGKEVLGDANRALSAAGIKAVAQVALAADGKNLNEVVKATMDSKPAAVLLGTAGAASTSLIAALRRASPRLPIAGLSVALTSSGVKQLGELAGGIAITMVFPDPSRAKHAISREFQAAMRANGQTEFSMGSFEGYVNTQVMAEAIERAGRDITRAKLRTALAGLRRVDLGGFGIDFTSAPYVGSKFVDLGILNDKGRYSA